MQQQQQSEEYTTTAQTHLSSSRAHCETHLRKIFSRSSAPFNRARRYSSRDSYRAVTSARRLRISANSVSMPISSSSSTCPGPPRLLPEPVEPASERGPGEMGLPILDSPNRDSRRVLPLRDALGCRGLPSLSSTVSSGR